MLQQHVIIKMFLISISFHYKLFKDVAITMEIIFVENYVKLY